MIPRGLILLLTICFVHTSMAQNTFKGKLIDIAGRQPIANARIISLDSSLTVLTDEDGRFSFLSSYEELAVSAAAVGYTPAQAVLRADGFNLVAVSRGMTNLKEITLTATANASKFSSLSLIDLSLNPVQSSQELLRLAPGLFVAQHAGGGKAEQIFLRGFDADHGTDVSVNVDGSPVNMVSHAHGQGYADAHFIIPETVNNIDFGAGPYYVNYGNFTTAGYINLSTYNSIEKSRIQVEAGRYNTYRALMMMDILKKHKDKTSAYLAADYNFTNGPTENKQHFNRFNLFGKFTKYFSEKTQLFASLSAFKSGWDASGQVPGRAIDMGMINRFGSLDPTEGGQTERYNANVIFKTKLGDNLSWESQVFYSRYLFNLYSNFTFFYNDPVRGDGIAQRESRNMAGAVTKLTRQKNNGSWKLKTTFAVGSRNDATKNSALFNQVKRVVYDTVKLGDIHETNAYTYLQEQISNNKWAIDAGLRLDRFHDRYTDHLLDEIKLARSEGIFSPKLNIQYTLNKRMQVYSKTGKGFHSNDTRVVVSNATQDILPAAYGSDLGIILKPSDHIILNVAVWYLSLGQEFVYVGDAGVVEPSGKTRRQGLDLTARIQFSDHLFANLNLNYTKARSVGETKGNNYIPLAPDLTSIGGIYYKAVNGFNGAISYRYIKSRPANEDNTIVAKGYFLLDAVVNFTQPKYEIGFSVENLLNAKWNEAQFATTSQLKNETAPVTELHFTPGTPFFAKIKFAVLF